MGKLLCFLVDTNELKIEMKVEEIIDKFARLTHSPKGKYAANDELYKELLARLPENDRPEVKPTVVRRIWWRSRAVASVAAAVCVSVAIACIVTFGEKLFTPSAPVEAPTETPIQIAPQTLVFNNEPLADIAASLSAVYDTEIVIEESDLVDYRLTATFTTDEPLDEILSILAEAGGFEVEKQGKCYILTHSE